MAENVEYTEEEQEALDEALALVAGLDEETALMILVAAALLTDVDIPTVEETDGDIHEAVRRVLKADLAAFVEAASLVLLFEAGLL